MGRERGDNVCAESRLRAGNSRRRSAAPGPCTRSSCAVASEQRAGRSSTRSHVRSARAVLKPMPHHSRLAPRGRALLMFLYRRRFSKTLGLAGQTLPPALAAVPTSGRMGARIGPSHWASAQNMPRAARGSHRLSAHILAARHAAVVALCATTQLKSFRLLAARGSVAQTTVAPRYLSVVAVLAGRLPTVADGVAAGRTIRSAGGPAVGYRVCDAGIMDLLRLNGALRLLDQGGLHARAVLNIGVSEAAIIAVGCVVLAGGLLSLTGVFTCVPDVLTGTEVLRKHHARGANAQN